MSASELDHHSEALVIREEVLLGREPLTSDLNLQRRPGLNVPNPVGGVTPTRADDCFVGFRVPRQGHRDSRARLAGLPPRVDDYQERVAQEPAPSPPVQRQRQSKNCKSETPWLPSNPEKRLRLRADWVGCDGSPDCRQRRILGRTRRGREGGRRHQREARSGALMQSPLSPPSIWRRQAADIRRTSYAIHESG